MKFIAWFIIGLLGAWVAKTTMFTDAEANQILLAWLIPIIGLVLMAMTHRSTK